MKTYAVHWRPEADEDMDKLLRYVARQSSLREARSLYRRLRRAAKPLAYSPLAYSPAPEWGEGVRRLPTLGRRILFEVDEAARTVNILAVVGGAENPRSVR